MSSISIEAVNPDFTAEALRIIEAFPIDTGERTQKISEGRIPLRVASETRLLSNVTVDGICLIDSQGSELHLWISKGHAFGGECKTFLHLHGSRESIKRNIITLRRIISAFTGERSLTGILVNDPYAVNDTEHFWALNQGINFMWNYIENPITWDQDHVDYIRDYLEHLNPEVKLEMLRKVFASLLEKGFTLGRSNPVLSFERSMQLTKQVELPVLQYLEDEMTKCSSRHWLRGVTQDVEDMAIAKKRLKKKFDPATFVAPAFEPVRRKGV